MPKRLNRPAGIATPGEPYPVCGASLFIVRDRKGRKCLICKSRLYQPHGEPLGSPPVAFAVRGYARGGAPANARQ